MEGQIYKIHSDLFHVKSAGDFYECKVREVLKKQRQSLLVGDFVEFDNNVISKILPRKTYIRRPSVANVNQVVVVSALKQPDLDFHQLNRYIALAKYYKIPVVLCFNKEDLGLESDAQDKILSIYGNLGYKVVFTSALEKKGIEEFRKLLKGKISALCGNSGVGKSSIINALFSKEKTQEGEISKKNKKGKNTTTDTKLYKLEENTYIADTPGFSSFEISEIESTELDKCFREFLPEMDKCEFVGCTHIKEENCGVKKAIQDGVISEERYERYCQMYNELKEKEKYRW